MRNLLFFSAFLLFLTSCGEDRQEYGFVRLVFQHQWDGQPFMANDATEYTNRAGNDLRFTRFQYIISDLTIGAGSGQVRVESPEVHFISGDTTILVTYQIPVGDYNLISFIFGLDERRNQPNMFPDLTPLMRWPGHQMGGGGGEGYHYMMLDGRWMNSPAPNPPTFRLHLGALEELFQVNQTVLEWGVGPPPNHDVFPIRTQIDSVFARHHYFLRVSVPRIFTVRPNEITTLPPIIMDVEQWLESPLLWDFSTMGVECTMPRRYALDSLASNGTAGLFRSAEITRGRLDPVFRTFTVIR